MKKILLVIMILFLCGCTNESKEDNLVTFKLKIIEKDISTNESRYYDEYVVQENDIVILNDREFYLCNRKPNDIKIISLNDDFVTISREMLRYDSNDVNKTYTEEIIENINYNEEFDPSINEPYPLAPTCSQARYSYYLKFIKEYSVD